MATNASIARREARERAELAARLGAMEKSIASQASEIEKLKDAIQTILLAQELENEKAKPVSKAKKAGKK